MADRRDNQYVLGNPGRLVYSPFGVEQTKDCGWLSVRTHGLELPKFREVGPPQQCFSASQDVVLASTAGAWHDSQKQKKWLLKNHPQAFLGNEELDDLLIAELSSAQDSGSSSRLMQFDVGEMTDITDIHKTAGVPLLAMATGLAGDVLRLMRPRIELWQSEQDERISMQLLDCEDYQETLWTKDVGMIKSIQCVVSSRRYEPVRWVIVQRETGTSVFRPEYQKVPVVSEIFSGTGPRPPSHIAPNLLFSILKDETGRDAHADAAFNPGVKTLSPQLAIIDQGGNWSIWDVSRIRNRKFKCPKRRLFRRGNIRQGIKTRVPRDLSSTPGWHKIFWVGRSEIREEFDGSDDEDEIASASSSSFPVLERSSLLLLCNSRTLRLLDLEAGVFLPDLAIISEGSKDDILDVRIDAQDPRYFYVATQSRLFVLGILSNVGSPEAHGEKRVQLLQSFPHFRSKLDTDLNITVAPGPSSVLDRTALVILSSRGSGWHDTFCIGFMKETPQQIVCLHDSMIVKEGHDANNIQSLQTLRLSPVLVGTPTMDRHSGEARLFAADQTRVFQTFSFGSDFSLTCSLSLNSCLPWNDYRPSFRPIGKSEILDRNEARPAHYPKMSDKFSEKELERRKALRYLLSRFVVPDSLSEYHGRLESIRNPWSVQVNPPTRKPLRRMIRTFYDHFRTFARDSSSERAQNIMSSETSGHGSIMFDPVVLMAQTGLDSQLLPATSIFEVVQPLMAPTDIGQTSRELIIEMERLQRIDPAVNVLRLVKRNGILTDSSDLQDVYYGLVDVFLDFDPVEHALEYKHYTSSVAARQLACDLYLSSSGIAYWPPQIPESQSSTSLDALPPSLVSADTLLDTQETNKSTLLSSGFHQDSHGSSRASTPASSVPSASARSTADLDSEDPAVALLQALTGSGGPVKKRNSALAAGWKLGQNPDDFVFSVEKSTEITPGMHRRAKQEAREARKRKRVETLLQLQREHNLLPSTQPASDSRAYALSSQPANALSSPVRIKPSVPVVTMSQPVAGTFGGRSESERPKKRPKRKGGF